MALGRIPILLYHSLTSRASPAYRRFAVDPGAFRTQMDLLAEAGVRTATIGELVALGSDVPPSSYSTSRCRPCGSEAFARRPTSSADISGEQVSGWNATAKAIDP